MATIVKIFSTKCTNKVALAVLNPAKNELLFINGEYLNICPVTEYVQYDENIARVSYKVKKYGEYKDGIFTKFEKPMEVLETKMVTVAQQLD